MVKVISTLVSYKAGHLAVMLLLEMPLHSFSFFLTVLLVTVVDLTKQSPQIGVLEYCLEEFSSRYINFDENTIVCKLMEIKIRRHILSLNMHPQKSLKHREGGRHNDFLIRQVLSGFVIRLATQTRV